VFVGHPHLQSVMQPPLTLQKSMGNHLITEFCHNLELLV